MNIKDASNLVGGLSAPSKMPCYGYSIPAKHCKQGSKMVAIPNSICSKCYALKGFYRMGNVQAALQKRFDSLRDPNWTLAMASLILNKEKSGFFRWHDSGDLQGEWHLQNIATVCALTPNIQHWLPTREFAIVRRWREKNEFPANLTVRLSALMFDGDGPHNLANRLGCQTSGARAVGYNCKANQTTKLDKKGDVITSKKTGKVLTGFCGDCRACWDTSIGNVDYKPH
jgi:hypothetical protein